MLVLIPTGRSKAPTSAVPLDALKQEYNLRMLVTLLIFRGRFTNSGVWGRIASSTAVTRVR